MRIVKIEAAECRLPLPKPILLGAVTIKTRDFIALRLTTDNGFIGDAIGYPRATPLLESVRRLGSYFLGQSPHARRGLVEHLSASLVNGRPQFVRAMSLFDIALHDLAAKAVELPLFRLLGGARTKIPVMAVAGYYLNERSAGDVRDEVSRLLDAGYGRMKIMINGNDPLGDTKLVGLVNEVAAGKLGVDAHWSWNSIPQALETCRAIDDMGLRFIEDPFGAHRNHLIGLLGQSLATPIACGEDVPDADALFALTDQVSILRVDATSCGGIDAAISVIHAAGLKGCEILPHVHLPVHAQLAGAFSQISFAEYIPEATGADPIGTLLARPAQPSDGFVVLDEEPGGGWELDWDTVGACAADALTLDWEGR